MVVNETRLFGQQIPVGTDLLFQSESLPHCVVGIEICEDLWTPVPPSGFHALAGATVIANLSASNITIGKDDYRRSLCASQSARCLAAYAYSAAGSGESTTDLAWDGHALVAENGILLAESERYSSDASLILADIDTERLVAERMRQTSWGDSRQDFRDRIRGYRTVTFAGALPTVPVRTVRRIPRDPYVPAEGPLRDTRCAETYAIQVHGLEQRMRASRFERIAIGVSGGLDSTHALIVAARTVDRLGIPRKNIVAVTMPGYATSDRTLRNARQLMESLGVDAREIDIRPSCEQMMRDIGHPFVEGKPVYDVTFENVQAGERTSHLFRLANQENALV
ncbi:MAG: NAD(+) synthase, partial [Armatimonadaceae bacterium]